MSGFDCVHQSASPSWIGGDLDAPPIGGVFGYVVTALNAAGDETSPGTGTGRVAPLAVGRPLSRRRAPPAPIDRQPLGAAAARRAPENARRTPPSRAPGTSNFSSRLKRGIKARS